MLCSFVERSGSGLYRIIYICMEDGLSNPKITKGLDRSRVIVSTLGTP